MAKRTWMLMLDDERHIIELEHGYFSGKRSIRIDGKQLQLPSFESQQLVDTGSRHAFRLSGHNCMLVILTNGLTFNYDLEVDGRSITTGQPTDASLWDLERSLRARRLTTVILFAVIGVGAMWWNWNMAHSRGYYSIGLAFISPQPLVLAVYYAIFRDDPAALPRPIPLRMWLVIAFCLLAGAINYFALAKGLY